MNNVFENIKHIDEAGQVYWSARELSVAIGYKKYENFKPVINKAIRLCQQNGQNVEYHFPQVQEMITIGKGGNRKVESYHLSRYACLLVSMSLSSKKEMALPALEYFSGKQNIMLDSSQSIDVRTVSYHINEILESGELNKYSVVQKSWITAAFINILSILYLYLKLLLYFEFD